MSGYCPPQPPAGVESGESGHASMEAKYFVAGATYRLRKDHVAYGHTHAAGGRWVFWRDAYSHYDGIHFYFFAAPAAFHGPPQPDFEAVQVFTWELPDGARDDPTDWFEQVEPPPAGPMWMLDLWADRVRSASKPR